MTRHVADRRPPASGAKTAVFLEIDRKAIPSPAVMALARQPRAPRNADKLVQFLRIARGRTA